MAKAKQPATAGQRRGQSEAVLRRAARAAAREASRTIANAPRAVKKAQGMATSMLGDPPEHVDLVKNEWLAGYQVVVARVSVKGGAIDVDTNDADYREVVTRPVAGFDPKSDPDGFLRALADHIHGSYLFATEPHDEATCPYRGMVVPMQSQHERLQQPEPV